MITPYPMPAAVLSHRTLGGGSARWERILSPYDHRKTVYWRLVSEDGRHGGAVSLKDAGWRALAYDPQRKRSDLGRVELGDFPTRAKAQRAVEKDWEQQR